MNNLQLTMALFRDVLVGEVKKYAIENNTEPVSAFKEVADSYYWYSMGQLERAGNKPTAISRSGYRDMLYRFMKDNECIPIKYFNLIRRYYGYSAEPCELDDEYRITLINQLEAERQHFEAIKARTAPIREILGKQKIMTVLDFIGELVEYRQSEDNYSETLLGCELFNYGFILGKRAERARRKP